MKDWEYLNNRQHGMYVPCCDANDKMLSPSSANTAVYLINAGKAEIISTYPLMIRLFRVVND